MGEHPPVVAWGEIGEMLGVSKRRISQLLARPDFPAPIAELGVGRIWAYDDVRAWAEGTGRTVHPLSSD